jgi:predicted hydrocarbon binding protein
MKNKILSQMTMEAGQLTLKGIRYMLIRPDTIVDFQKAVEAAVGQENCAEMMTAGGMTGGSKSSQQYRKLLGCSEEDIVNFMWSMGDQLGWGVFNLILLDMKSERLVVEVSNSPFADAYGRSEASVCHIIRGVLAGLSSTIFKGKVLSLETTCVAKGDKRCRFEITKYKT